MIARQRGWSNTETAHVALQAGTGHVLSTLVIAVMVWIVGATAAKQYGAAIDTASSLALIGFGLWVAISAWHEQRRHHTHPHHERANAENHADEHRAGTGAGATNHRRSRTVLLLIVGSSPMVKRIPVFFAAGNYGRGLIVVMAVVFATSTIATYVLLCVSSTARLQSFNLGAFELQP
jgi:ABC-type nickel/cobalt efflux system permease component RcnA